MKIFVYKHQGRMQYFTPAEGSRLALQVTLADGRSLVYLNGNIVEMQAEDELIPKVAPLRQPLEAWKFVRPWPAPDVVATWAETVEQQLERLRPYVIPAGAESVAIVDAETLPGDRTFREAWSLDSQGACVVNMAAAREIHCNALRALREPKLAALDVEFIRALEAGDTARCSAIAAEKQALRDVTKDAAITKATTPEELKAVIPGALLS